MMNYEALAFELRGVIRNLDTFLDQGVETHVKLAATHAEGALKEVGHATPSGPSHRFLEDLRIACDGLFFLRDQFSSYRWPQASALLLLARFDVLLGNTPGEIRAKPSSLFIRDGWNSITRGG